MPKVFRELVRLLVVVGIVAWLQPFTTMLEADDSTGRDFSQCVQACNAARLACNDRAIALCQEMFPNDETARDACKAAGKAECSVESDDCKLVCKAIKDGETPENP